MDCPTFENRLTQLLAGELDAAGSRATIEDLERHARACPDCAAAEPWIELAALSAGERDPVPDPGDEYWGGFNASVKSRLGAQESAAAPPWRRYAVAAALVVALGSGWLLRGWLDPQHEAAEMPERITSTEWSLLEEVIREATPEELAAALRNLPGGEHGGFEVTDWDLGRSGLGDWLPGLDELDDIDEVELLEWLDETETEGRPTS